MRTEIASPQTRKDGQPPIEGAPQSGSLHPRLAWIICYNDTRSAKEVCRRFNISKKTFYKWLKRYRESNGSSFSLADQSRRPHTSPRATPEAYVVILREAKEQTGFGQRRLRAYVEEKYNIRLSERTIWKLLRAHETSVPQQSNPSL